MGCDLIVQVLSGQNMPLRTDVTLEGLAESPSSLIVECRFQSNIQITRSLPGPQPSWHELLKLPIIPFGDSFSPSRLVQMKDELHFDIFDVSIESEQPGDYRLHHTRLHHKKLKWIGSFSVPFTTIYLNGVVE